MQKPIIYILLCLTISKIAGASGTIVGNHGSVVDCLPSEDNDFQGLYSLDYIAALGSNADNEFLDSNVPMEQMIEYLLQSFPEAGRSLQDFKADLLSNSPLGKYVWFGLNTPLQSVSENLVSLLYVPENCHPKDGEIQQAIHRANRGGTTVFTYNAPMLEKLKANNLSFSFLMVHEWLWEHTLFASDSHDLNAFLHSKSSYKLEPENFKAALKEMDFSLNIGNTVHFEVNLRQSIDGILKARSKELAPNFDSEIRVRFVNTTDQEIQVKISGNASNHHLKAYHSMIIDLNQNTDIYCKTKTDNIPCSPHLNVK